MQQIDQGTELIAVEIEIPNEPFESKARKIRDKLTWVFFHTHAAEVYVTDGKQSAKFTVGRDDYDLDSGSHLTNPIPITEAGDVRALIEEIANFTPPYRSELPPKGIVPLDAEVERLLQAHPGIELKFGDVGMPYGLGGRVRYYERRKGV
jgi:hypothetical protein